MNFKKNDWWNLCKKLTFKSENKVLHVPKADPGLAHQARAPLFEKRNRVYFCKFWLHITHIYLNCSKCAMFMICILFSTDSEQIGYMWGVSKHIPRIQKFYQGGAMLPGFKIPGSTPVYIISFMILYVLFLL